MLLTLPLTERPGATPGLGRSAVKRRVASLLTAGLLAAAATAVLAATPAQAFHRHHYRHAPPGPAYGYDYRPAPYPPVAYPPVVVAPPVYAAPPPVWAGPVVAGPLPSPAPATVPATVPAPWPPAEAGYATGPVPPGPDRIGGTPDCLVVREYTTEIEVGGEPVEGYGYACLKADGSWQRGVPVPAR